MEKQLRETWGISVTLTLAESGEAPGDPRHCMVIPSDDRSRIAITMWMYRALRRADRDQEATELLETVSEGLSLSDGPTRYESSTIKPGSNEHYYRTRLLHRGLLEEEEILDKELNIETFMLFLKTYFPWADKDSNVSRIPELLDFIKYSGRYTKLVDLKDIRALSAGVYDMICRGCYHIRHQ